MVRARSSARQLELFLALIWASTFVSMLVAESARDEVIRLASLLGIGEWAVWVAQTMTAVLAASALRGIRSRRVVAAHAAMIAGVSGLSALADSTLLTHPFGHIVLNGFLVLVTYLAYQLRSSGWNRGFLGVTVGGIGFVWVFQGLVPKILFQNPIDLDLVDTLTGGRGEPSQLLLGLGVLEVFVGLLTVVLRGRWLSRLLLAESVGLIALGILSGVIDPPLWWSPFAPLTKTLLVGFTALIVAQSLSAGEGRFQGAKKHNSG